MNKANVWSLADLGDVNALEKAIRNTPSCLDVPGWSYAVDGKRKGIFCASRDEEQRGRREEEDDDSENSDYEEDATTTTRKLEGGGGGGAGGTTDGSQSEDEEGGGNHSNNTSEHHRHHPMKKKKKSHHHRQPWTITKGGEGVNPGTILQYAAVRGWISLVVLALELGASVDTLGSVKALPDEIARKQGFDDVAETIAKARKRRNDPLGILVEEEERRRNIILVRESTSRKETLEEPFEDGIVTISISFRDNGLLRTYTLSVPRYLSHTTLHKKIEDTVGQRVLVSFEFATSLLSDRGNTSDATGGGAHNNSSSATLLLTNGSSSSTTHHNHNSSKKNNKPAGAIRLVELRPKTTPLFLHMESPTCVARPLVYCLPTSEMQSKPQQDTVSAKLLELSHDIKRFRATSPSSSSAISPIRAQSMTRAASPPAKRSSNLSSSSLQHHHKEHDELEARKERLEQMKKLLADLEQTHLKQQSLAATEKSNNSNNGTNSGTMRSISRRKPAALPKVFKSPEELEESLQRLYDRPMNVRAKKVQEYEEFCKEGSEKYVRTCYSSNSGAELDPAVADTVQRLYEQEVEQHKAAIAKAEDKVEQSLVRPKQCSLSEEEVDQARARLAQPASVKKKALEKLEKKYYGEMDDRHNARTLEKDELDRLIQSVYSDGVSKKKEAREKLDALHGDFRVVRDKANPPRKLTAAKMAEVSDRLKTKH